MVESKHATLVDSTTHPTVYKMTYTKEIPKRISANNRNQEFTYTSELKDQRQANAGSAKETEYLARVDPEENLGIEGSIEKQLIAGNSISSQFETLHIVTASRFNPWTVLEKYPTKEGMHEVYMMFATGENYAVKDARVEISVFQYSDDANELRSASRQEYEARFRTVYSEPFQFSEVPAGRYKKVVANFEISEIDLAGGKFTAVKVALVNDGREANIADFYWEGISVLPSAGKYRRRDPKKCCQIF